MAGVRVTGLNETLRNLKKLGASMEDLKDVMYSLAQPIVQDAQTLAPVNTGALRESIRASKAQRTAVIRAGSAKVNYASFIEFGTGVLTPTEMVKSAIEQNESNTANKLDKELQRLINRYGLN